MMDVVVRPDKYDICSIELAQEGWRKTVAELNCSDTGFDEQSLNRHIGKMARLAR